MDPTFQNCALDVKGPLGLGPGFAEVIDLETATPHLYRGDEDALREQLQHGLDILDTEDLKHGYRSDFGASAVSSETVAELEAYLSAQLERLSE